MNPLNTIQGTIVAGVILAIVLALVTMGVQFNVPSLIMWVHVLAGITWIGLLYYFNFVQVPALAAAAKDQGGPGGAGIGKWMLETVIAIARDKGYQQLTLETIAPLKEAIALYIAYGFSETTPKEINDRVDRAFVLHLS